MPHPPGRHRHVQATEAGEFLRVLTNSFFFFFLPATLTMRAQHMLLVLLVWGDKGAWRIYYCCSLLGSRVAVPCAVPLVFLVVSSVATATLTTRVQIGSCGTTTGARRIYMVWSRVPRTLLFCRAKLTPRSPNAADDASLNLLNASRVQSKQSPCARDI